MNLKGNILNFQNKLQMVNFHFYYRVSVMNDNTWISSGKKLEKTNCFFVFFFTINTSCCPFYAITYLMAFLSDVPLIKTDKQPFLEEIIPILQLCDALGSCIFCSDSSFQWIPNIFNLVHVKTECRPIHYYNIHQVQIF